MAACNNLEIKCALPEGALGLLIKRLTPHFSETLQQTDTYYTVPDGRLKLRQIQSLSADTPEEAQLIAYKRPVTNGQRTSLYHIAGATDGDAMARALAFVLPVEVCVKKTRHVFLPKQHVRLHLDVVQDLGTFAEIEVIAQGDTDQRAHMAYWMGEMGLTNSGGIAEGYRELLLAQQSATVVRDFAYYQRQNKVFWYTDADVPNTPIRRSDIVPCIFVEEVIRPDGAPQFNIVQLAPDIKHDGYKYTAWRRLVGETYGVRMGVLLIHGDGLVTLQGEPVQFDSLGRSAVVVDKAFLARFAPFVPGLTK